jgi:hypothetical protein
MDVCAYQAKEHFQVTFDKMVYYLIVALSIVYLCVLRSGACPSVLMPSHKRLFYAP